MFSRLSLSRGCIYPWWQGHAKIRPLCGDVSWGRSAIDMYIYIHAHMYIYLVCVYMYVFMHVCVYIYIYIYMHGFVYVCVWEDSSPLQRCFLGRVFDMYVCICMYVCMYVVYVCMSGKIRPL